MLMLKLLSDTMEIALSVDLEAGGTMVVAGNEVLPWRSACLQDAVSHSN